VKHFLKVGSSSTHGSNLTTKYIRYSKIL